MGDGPIGLLITALLRRAGIAEAVHLAEQGWLPFSRLVTHIVPAQRFADGIALARSHDDDVIKVVLTWPGTAQTI